MIYSRRACFDFRIMQNDIWLVFWRADLLIHGICLIRILLLMRRTWMMLRMVTE